ncbi:hypothetical protein TWF696_005610 [Orbilia brochopaga]|uniref:Uncharacterized protein n=1 Tax=Orbilia brochopaga TaxID=3140254 RepID=A0AAV9V2Y2_9PEZI
MHFLNAGKAGFSFSNPIQPELSASTQDASARVICADTYHSTINFHRIDLSKPRPTEAALSRHSRHDLPVITCPAEIRPQTVGVRRSFVSGYYCNEEEDYSTRQISIACTTEHIPLGNHRRGNVVHSPSLTGRNGKTVAAQLTQPVSVVEWTGTHNVPRTDYFPTGVRVERHYGDTTTTGQPNTYGDNPYTEDWSHPDDTDVPRYSYAYADPNYHDQTAEDNDETNEAITDNSDAETVIKIEEDDDDSLFDAAPVVMREATDADLSYLPSPPDSEPSKNSPPIKKEPSPEIKVESDDMDVD